MEWAAVLTKDRRGNPHSPPNRQRSEDDQGADRQSLKFFSSVQEGQFNEKRDGDNLGPDFSQQGRRRTGRSARGEEIIDQRNSTSRFDRVHMDRDRVGPVLEIIRLLVSLVREFAFLPHRNESGVQFERSSSRKYEPSGIDAHDSVNRAWCQVLRQQVDATGEQAGNRQDWSDVLKLNAGLWEIRNRSDGAS